jgi:hypothetical protein
MATNKTYDKIRTDVLQRVEAAVAQETADHLRTRVQPRARNLRASNPAADAVQAAVWSACREVPQER